MDFLIADDHGVVLSGLVGTLEKAFKDARFSLAHNSAEVFQLLSQKSDYDIALVDLAMPGMQGFAFLRQLCDDYPELTVAVISASDDPETIRKVIALGALGFIPKSVSADTLINAVRLITSGDVYLPAHLLREEAEQPKQPPKPKLPVNEEPVGVFDTLTERQREILMLLGEGNSNKDIARTLGLSENTIKVHVSSILKALNVRNRTQAGVIGEKLKQSDTHDDLAD